MSVRRALARASRGARRAARSRAAKTLVAIFGLFLLIEVFLNVAGALYYRPIERELARPARATEEDFVILCAGDSHVYGIDADRDLTWPRQLEGELESLFAGVNVEVINTGVPGYNSSETLAVVEASILDNPGRIDMIILEAGRNNSLSFRNASVLPRDFHLRSWTDQARYLLMNAKTYRLSLLTELNLMAALKLNWKPLFQVNLSKDFLREWLIHDYTRVCEVAEDNDIIVVLMNYVIPGDLMNGYVTTAMRQVSRDRGVVFVDIENFRLPAAAYYTLPVLNTGDGHPNERGNRVIAEILRDELCDNPRLSDPLREILGRAVPPRNAEGEREGPRCEAQGS